MKRKTILAAALILVGAVEAVRIFLTSKNGEESENAEDKEDGGQVNVRRSEKAENNGVFAEKPEEDIILVDVTRDEIDPDNETVNRFLNRYNMVNPSAQVSEKNLEKSTGDSVSLHAYDTLVQISEKDGSLNLVISCDENGDFSSVEQMYYRCLKTFLPLLSEKEARQRSRKILNAYGRAESAKTVIDDLSCIYNEENSLCGGIETLTIRGSIRKLQPPEFEMLLADRMAKNDGLNQSSSSR